VKDKKIKELEQQLADSASQEEVTKVQDLERLQSSEAKEEVRKLTRDLEDEKKKVQELEHELRQEREKAQEQELKLQKASQQGEDLRTQLLTERKKLEEEMKEIEELKQSLQGLNAISVEVPVSQILGALSHDGPKSRLISQVWNTLHHQQQQQQQQKPHFLLIFPGAV